MKGQPSSRLPVDPASRRTEALLHFELLRAVFVDEVLVLAAVGRGHRQEEDEEQHRRQKQDGVELLVPQKVHEEHAHQGRLHGGNDHGDDQVALSAQIERRDGDRGDGEHQERAQDTEQQWNRHGVRQAVTVAGSEMPRTFL